MFVDGVLSPECSGELFWGASGAAGRGELLCLRAIRSLTVVCGWAEGSEAGGEAAGADSAVSFWLVEVTCSSCSLRSLFSRMISSNVFTLTVSLVGLLFPFACELNGANNNYSRINNN